MSDAEQPARLSEDQLEERLMTVQERLTWAYANGSSQIVFALEQAQNDLMRQLHDRYAAREAEEIKRAASVVVETDPDLAKTETVAKPGATTPKKQTTPTMPRITRTSTPVVPDENQDKDKDS
jgi:3-methyladenine DNA glycosylase/8-oxoguanine DNA glycosylase